MNITSVSLTHFRCFKQLNLQFTAPIALIEGDNGSGKTSILEALHYGCYLRSFRTASPTQLITFDEHAFCIKISGITDQESWQLTAGFSQEKQRLVTLHGKTVTSYKSIIDRYRVITIMEDDLDIIRGYPASRRSFLDTILFMMDPAYSTILRDYEKIVRQRNSLLEKKVIDQATYNAWTEPCKELSQTIQEKRQKVLSALEHNVNILLQHMQQISLSLIFCTYKAKLWNEQAYDHERRAQKTLYGAHFDDIEIVYADHYARHFASRGQQKMLVILFKIAALTIVQKPALILIDDFMTDLDKTKIEELIGLLIKEKHQIIMSCPLTEGPLSIMLRQYDAQTIMLQKEIYEESNTCFSSVQRSDNIST
jgi:DNA replication and repair protein RecF